MNIGTEWIQIAIENGGSLDISKTNGYFMARMRWRNRHVVMGECMGCVGLALDKLDTALCDDAASEMEEQHEGGER